jgi:hypothetical protein
MAVKILGVPVISDSRDISNIGVVTATTYHGDGSNLSGLSRFVSVQTRVGISTVNTFVGVVTVFGRSSNVNVPV